MKKRTRLLSLALSGATALAIAAVPASAKYFSDVSIGHWARESINYVADNGFMDPATSSTFDPDGTFTRADVAKMLYRFEGSPSVSVTSQFTDVSSSASYAKAVSWMYSKGIMTGTTSTTFEPATGIKRQDLAVTLYRYANYVDDNNGAIKKNALSKSADITGYSDYSKVYAYARDAMSWAVGVKLITGEVGGALEPRKVVVRETGAEFLKRYGIFVEGINFDRDAYNFVNSSSNFTKGYYVNQTHKEILFYYLDLYGESDIQVYVADGSFSGSYKSYVEKSINSNTWNGSCYGMAMTVALNKLGKVDFVGNFGSTQKALRDFNGYNSQLFSAINYYHVNQTIHTIINSIIKVDNTSADWRSTLATLPQLIDNNGILGFGIRYDGVGHSLVLYDYEAIANGYKLYVYDPNSLNEVTLVLNTKSDTLTYNGHDVTSISYFEDMSSKSNVFNKYDIDSPYNDFGAGASSVNDMDDADVKALSVFDYSDKIMLAFDFAEDYVVTNSEGKTLRCVNGELSGDMTVYGKSYVESTGHWLVLVNESENFTFN